jgi:hypothetical protein
MARTGTADLPLHGGHVPRWLANRMTALGRVVAEAIVVEYGAEEFLRRVAHPFWFQAFGAVMGMDWHSSGITTSVLGALKRGLAPIEDELGLFVCGGRGANARKTPDELGRIAERTGLDGARLTDASRLVAKVDGAAVQDGFDLYLHGFLVTRAGSWAVVQQGMRPADGTARRYHWLSEGLGSFVDAPHTAIEGANVGAIVNLAHARAERARRAQTELVQAGPDYLVREIARAQAVPSPRVASAPAQGVLPLPHLALPRRHEVTSRDVVLRRLHATLAAAHARGPVDFVDVLRTPGIGARAVFAIAMVAEVIHGAPCRFTDPARMSLAHGGKDGHPFPVPLKVYDATIRVLKDAVRRARKLGEPDRVAAIRRLDAEARRLEGAELRASAAFAGGGPPSFDAFVTEERRNGAAYGGKCVGGKSS